MRNKVEIKFAEDKCVEITFDQEVFRVALDERGLPEFPESMKELLPPYVRERLEQRIKSKRGNPNQGPICMTVSHEPWCPEMMSGTRCHCNPDLCEVEIVDYSGTGIGGGKLACKVCDESSIGETILSNLVEDDSGRWERFWIEGADMFYWLVAIPETEVRLLICHLCMIDLRIKFPNTIECEKDSRDYQH